jgi:hypothetical protein
MKLCTIPRPDHRIFGLVALAAAIGALGLAGCHSHFIEADIRNASGSPVTLLEVDYPSASFGKDRLATSAAYHYRFKVLGEGPTKILWTDVRQVDHTVAGPVLREGQEGTLTVTITGPTATWQTNLH